MTFLNRKIKTIITTFLLGLPGIVHSAAMEEGAKDVMTSAKRCLNYVLWNAQLLTFPEADIRVGDDRDAIELAFLQQARPTRSVGAYHQFLSGTLKDDQFYEVMRRLAKDGDNGAAKILWDHGKISHITDITSEEFGELDLMAMASGCIPAQYQTCCAVAHADLFMVDKRAKLRDMADRGNMIAGSVLRLTDAALDRLPLCDELDDDESEFLKSWKHTSATVDSDDITLAVLPAMIHECIVDAIKGSRKARHTLFGMEFSHSGKDYTKGLIELHLASKCRVEELDKITWALSGWLDICMLVAGVNNL